MANRLCEPIVNAWPDLTRGRDPSSHNTGVTWLLSNVYQLSIANSNNSKTSNAFTL